MRLILIRHAQSMANARGVVEGGGGNSALSGLGATQAHQAAAFLVGEIDDLKEVVASPQRRAVATAAPIATGFGVTVRYDPALIEGRLGAWEGATFDSVDWSLLRDDPDYRLHGGESPAQLARRGAKALERLRSRHDDGTVVVVSHGATISHALATLFETTPVIGTQYPSANTGMTFLDWADRRPRLVASNRTDHIDE